MTQSMAASDNRPPSRLVLITVGASNAGSVKWVPEAQGVIPFSLMNDASAPTSWVENGRAFV